VHPCMLFYYIYMKYELLTFVTFTVIFCGSRYVLSYVVLHVQLSFVSSDRSLNNIIHLYTNNKDNNIISKLGHLSMYDHVCMVLGFLYHYTGAGYAFTYMCCSLCCFCSSPPPSA
jgi:hypothetical protein